MNTQEKPIYLDNHATTLVDSRVAAVVLHAMTTEYGNPNSVDHIFGDNAAKMITTAQKEVCKLIGGEDEIDNVHFTSGSSEAIQLAIAHAVNNRPHKDKPLKVAVSTVEHQAVLDTLSLYEQSAEVSIVWIPVDTFARINLGILREACGSGIDLICVMAANNEVGTIYPIEQIAQLANTIGAATLVDATQAAGRLPIHADEWNISYLAINAHKMHGPKGIGALVTSSNIFIQRNSKRLRSTGNGTPNVPGIAGFGEACRLRRMEMLQDEAQIAIQRDYLESMLLEKISGLVVNGDRSNRLSNNLHVAVPDLPNDAVLARLRHSLAISTGAACTSAVDAPSHVLRAMGLPEDLQNGSLRMGLSKFTTKHEVERAATYLAEAIADLREVVLT